MGHSLYGFTDITRTICLQFDNKDTNIKVQTADTIITDLANGNGRQVKGSNMSGQK